MPKLEIKSENRSRVVEFNDARLTLGRQSDNDVVIKDKAASRTHCVIEQKNGSFQVKDLESQNGTWIGENRVIESSLTFNETVRIGKTLIRLLPDEADADQPASTTEVIHEKAEERPPVSPGNRMVKGSRAIVSGPLSKQLAPLLRACADVPIPANAPETQKAIRLLNKRSRKFASPRGRDAGTTGDAIEALRQLLFVAFRTRATDIHVEPKGDTFTLRFRIDGLMHNVGAITTRMGISILNVIKILCEVDIAKKSIVQEGNFAVELISRRVDFRVNLTPTVHGQKLALRILDKGAVPDQFDELGMAEGVAREFNRICSQDAGMVILAGPTGSGKTTTLYTALKSISAETRNIVTIEDPVEYELAGTTQISIDPRHDLTFASALGSVLRQDPDVILVGEIRDQETARIAMQAATTGHLVLTTLHARDTVGTIFRLLDLGVEPFLIASAVTMCLSQRLVRTLCDNCKRPYRPDARQIRQMGLEGRTYGQFYDSVGCQRCMNVGFQGRSALFEILLFNAQLRDVILTQPTISDIRKAAGEWMFETLTECGYRKVIDGTTTLKEIDRVSGMG